jgi:glycogen debranching enzyme
LPLSADEQAPTTRKSFALKQDDSFVVADAWGDILGDPDGVFCDDTRVLSRFRIMLSEQPLSVLGAAVSGDNVFFTANATNRPLPPLGGPPLPEGVIHVERRRFLWLDQLYECVRLVNYGTAEADLEMTIEFAADFRDMFELRGLKRAARGRLSAPRISEDRVILSYEGLDKVTRSSIVAFSEKPSRLTAERADFAIVLPALTPVEFYVEVGADPSASPSRARFRAAAARACRTMREKRRRSASLRSSGRLFNNWLARSAADLALLTTETPTGPYPYAGIPWFCAPFGRDAIVASFQTLWLNPALARGVLAFLAKYQAHETSDFRDSAPGKIVHEMRRGEMAALGEIPFGRYYGSVDTTPLFIALAGAYAERTADMAFIDELWPALNEAMGWIDGAGDSNHDGFVDYVRAANTGLANQGWKDSGDAIFHADGRTPPGPIALIEVQAYVHAAYSAMAALNGRRGDAQAAKRWRSRAETLRAAVEDRFWMDDLQFYAIALDGEDELCRVRASNAGHLLYFGLPGPERAARVAEQLMSPRFNSGWGIRTLAAGETRFNPMSYHNGAVWPHDTALAAAGIARYGDRSAIVRLLSQMFEAAVHFEMGLPELFCGFHRRPGEAPIAYPVASLPQAWSAGSVFMLLQACLGLSIDGWKREILIDQPKLPIGIEEFTLRNLMIGSDRIDIAFQRDGNRVVALPKRAGADSISIVMRD